MSSRSVLRCPSGQVPRKGYSYVNKKSGKKVSVKAKCVKKGKRSAKKSVTRKAKSPVRGRGQCRSGEDLRKGYSYNNKKSGKRVVVKERCVKNPHRSIVVDGKHISLRELKEKVGILRNSPHRVTKSGCRSPSKWVVPKAYCRSPRKRNTASMCGARRNQYGMMDKAKAYASKAASSIKSAASSAGKYASKGGKALASAAGSVANHIANMELVNMLTY